MPVQSYHEADVVVPSASFHYVVVAFVLDNVVAVVLYASFHFVVVVFEIPSATVGHIVYDWWGYRECHMLR